MKMNSDAFGFLLVDKKEGVTSSFVDIKAKKAFNTRRVGHLGTLDPFASGLLLLAIGEATKLLPLVPDNEKTYEAVLQLGEETDTLDRNGKITATLDVPPLEEEKIQEVLSSFLGTSNELPPKYSAKWIDGKRAYDLAREGIEFQQKPIDITIHQMELLSFDKEEKRIAFRTTVSRGTYIRSLGLDIAKRLGTTGYLSSLRRTQIGSLHVRDAVAVEGIPDAVLLPPESVIPGLTTIELDERKATRALNGLPLSISSDFPYLLFTHDGKRIALYRNEGPSLYHCLRGFSHA